MSFVCQFAESIVDAALAASEIVLLVSHLGGDSVCRLESYAPDVVGQSVWIGFDCIYALFAVLFVYLRSKGSAYSIALQEEHHILDILLLLPTVTDFLYSLLADARNFVELLNVSLDDIDSLQSEA